MRLATRCLCFTILLAALYPRVSEAGLFGPDSFDECVLEEAKNFGNPSRELLAQIRTTCRKRFPIEDGPKAPMPRSLPDCGETEASVLSVYSGLLSTQARAMKRCFDTFFANTTFNQKHGLVAPVLLTPTDCYLPMYDVFPVGFLGRQRELWEEANPGEDIPIKKACKAYNEWVDHLRP